MVWGFNKPDNSLSGFSLLFVLNKGCNIWFTKIVIKQ